LDETLVDGLDRLATERHTNRSELLRRGVLAVLEAGDLRRADIDHQRSYRQLPQDPLIVEAAARMARETAPEW
jgi:Arc/MetJ-type ribon-helix-helix transcriptional regulator